MTFDTRAARGPDWRDRAACRDADPELFFPFDATGPRREQIRQAKQVCQACPVRARCLDWALVRGFDFGIWGGTTEQERRVMRMTATVISRLYATG